MHSFVVSFVSASGAGPSGPGSESTAGDEEEPSEAIFIFVVVASAGRERLDAPAFLVSWSEGLRCCLCSWGVEEEIRSNAGAPLATEMLSRATSVIGAALDDLEADQTPGYQF